MDLEVRDVVCSMFVNLGLSTAPLLVLGHGAHYQQTSFGFVLITLILEILCSIYINT